MVATAKRDLKAGEILDGEGGYMVRGKIIPSVTSIGDHGLPLGLAHHVKLVRPVATHSREGLRPDHPEPEGSRGIDVY